MKAACCLQSQLNRQSMAICAALDGDSRWCQYTYLQFSTIDDTRPGSMTDRYFTGARRRKFWTFQNFRAATATIGAQWRSAAFTHSCVCALWCSTAFIHGFWTVAERRQKPPMCNSGFIMVSNFINCIYNHISTATEFCWTRLSVYDCRTTACKERNRTSQSCAKAWYVSTPWGVTERAEAQTMVARPSPVVTRTISKTASRRSNTVMEREWRQPVACSRNSTTRPICAALDGDSRRCQYAYLQSSTIDDARPCSMTDRYFTCTRRGSFEYFKTSVWPLPLLAPSGARLHSPTVVSALCGQCCSFALSNRHDFFRMAWEISWNLVAIQFVTWWRHQMETFSALMALCAGNSPFTGEFPAQRVVTRSFDVFFDLRLNKRLSKWWGWWFETPPRPLWRHYNETSYLPTSSERYSFFIHVQLKFAPRWQLADPCSVQLKKTKTICTVMILNGVLGHVSI